MSDASSNRKKPLTPSERKICSKLALGFGLVAVAAALLTPFVVAHVDEMARIAFEESGGEKSFLRRQIEGEGFVSPSESGRLCNYVLIFMIGVSACGAVAVISAWPGLFSTTPLAGVDRRNALIGFLAGPSAVFLTAWLSPAGLLFLGAVGVAALLMLLRLCVPVGDIGGGC